MAAFHQHHFTAGPQGRRVEAVERALLIGVAGLDQGEESGQPGHGAT